jgi:hypothetical protein
MELITGDLAEYVLKHILKEFDDRDARYKTPAVAGYFEECNAFTCFDNTSWNCWVEQAKTQEMAAQWCLGKIEAEDLNM